MNSFKRLTRRNKKGIPEIKNYMYIERAIGALCAYEETGYTPEEIKIMEEAIFNLQERVLKLEDWQ